MSGNPASTLIEALLGKRFPGGCDQCDAYQEMTRPDPDSAVFVCRISHDDDCPVLAAATPLGNGLIDGLSS